MKKLKGTHFHRRTTCRSCGGKNLKLVLRNESTPLGEEYIPIKHPQEYYPVDVFMCDDCKLLQLLDVVDPNILYRNYFYVTTLSLGLIKHFEDYAESAIHKLNIPENSFVIDIGSNDGILLKAFKERGMRVLGIDPAKEIAKKATESGYETIPEFFTLNLSSEIQNKYGKAKLITANNTIANIDNLDEVINGVKQLLDEDGVFIIEVAYALDIIQNTIIDNIYHEHLSYFSVKSLQNLFDFKGMEVIDVERTHMKGGSLRVFIQFKGGQRKKTSAVDELETLEESFGLYEPEIFKKFQERVKAEKKRIIKILKEAKSKGKVIVGYGASVGATVILHNFKIGKHIDFIADEYKPKQNLFSPGFHIPTFPPEEIYQRNPSYIINLAWRYAIPIIKKHNEFVGRGGKFITPFSKVGEEKKINDFNEGRRCIKCGSDDVIVDRDESGYTWMVQCNKCGYK